MVYSAARVVVQFLDVKTFQMTRTYNPERWSFTTQGNVLEWLSYHYCTMYDTQGAGYCLTEPGYATLCPHIRLFYDDGGRM